MSQQTIHPSSTDGTTAAGSVATMKGTDADAARVAASSTTSSNETTSADSSGSPDANATATTANNTSNTTRAPRGLLDLPLELSSMIYQLLVNSMNGDGRQVLAQPPMRAMAMTKVNSQTRNEFLPQFFAETWFIAVVGTNCGAPENNAAREQAGTLVGKEEVLTSLRSGGHLGRHVLLRAVTLVVIDSDPAAQTYHNLSRNWARHCIVRVRITVGKGCKIYVDTLSGSMHPEDLEAIDVQALNRCLENAEAITQAIGNRKNFSGFTLEDIETIAEEFRVQAKGDSDTFEMV